MSEPKTEPVRIEAIFECVLTVEPMKAMQAAGRTVFGLTRENPDPNAPDIRRDWTTDTVYDLRLMFEGHMVHRVMSDSLGDAKRLMRQGIQNLVFAAWRSQQGREFDTVQYQKMLTERRELAQFIEFNYRAEIQAGNHAQFGESLASTIFHYLSKERSRWSVKLWNLLRRKR